MATAARHKAKRERPEDGGIVWHEQYNAFECYGCGEFEEVRSASKRTPDKLAELREFLVLDHTECWEFDDPMMALDARRYRSEKKRRELLKARAARALDPPQRRGPIAGGPGLGRQSVSWRGR